jgi:tetratricopeptide (TPR) repeat protein
MRKFLLVALILGFTAQARAEDLESLLDNETKTEATPASRQQSFLVDTLRSLQDGRPTSEQNVFFRLLEAGEWEKSLLQSQAAFGGTAFERTPSGQALSAYLKFKTGLTTTGLEELFAIKDPKKIHFHLLNLWKEAAGEKHPAWTVALVKWTPEWTEIFGTSFEVKTRMRSINHKQSLEELKELVKKSGSDSKERAIAEWNLALAYSLNDQADLAAKIIAGLLKSKNSPASEDLLNLTAARLLFQNGYFDAAIKYYNKIPKKSDYWLVAQEETAWSYIRKGEPQNALAVTQTLVNPVFQGQLGPEPYFVRSLAQLKVCDYPGVVKGLVEFPKMFKNRTLALAKLGDEPEQPAVTKVLNELRTQSVKWEELGKDAQSLPRMITRDRRLEDLVRAQAELERESKVAEELYAKSLAQTGLQSSFENLKQSLLNRSRMAKSATLGRVQELAKNEVAETKKILDKMHIVEAEVIQQTSLAEQISKTKTNQPEVKVGSTGSKAQDVLRFPADGEVWFDELSNYQVSVKKACQVKR